MNTGGTKITGADFGAWDVLILIGYNIDNGKCYVVLDYGFDDTYLYFQTGVRRRIRIGKALDPFGTDLGQVEGICFKPNSLKGYTSNEYIRKRVHFVRITAKQSIDSFNIENYIKPYYNEPVNQKNYGTEITEPGTIRYNATRKKFQGYDGTHCLSF